MQKVSLASCSSYSTLEIERATAAIFEPYGGIEAIIKPGQRVLIKANLLMRRLPEAATTTHPEVIRALVKQVQSAGAHAVIADSPGGPYTRAHLQSVYDTCGMAKVASETGCELNDDFSSDVCIYPEGRVAKKLDIIGAARKADAIITVGKLKTHGLTTMTGCVKNLYGLVPGTVKVEYHARYTKLQMFCEMLLDTCTFAAPVFSVLDAVEAMEGEGPSGGRARNVGALIGGLNPHAVDALGARLIGLTCEQVPTLALAKARGIELEADIVGADVASLIQKDFDIPMLRSKRMGWIQLLDKVPHVFRPRPIFMHKACNRCGMCVRSCPVHAIMMNEKGLPKADYNACIRCFCCQELCPKTDIAVRRNPLIRMLR